MVRIPSFDIQKRKKLDEMNVLITIIQSQYKFSKKTRHGVYIERLV